MKKIKRSQKSLSAENVIENKKNQLPVICIGLIFLLSILACGSTIQKSIIINPKYARYTFNTVLVLPFHDRNKEPYKKLYSKAAEIMRESFETALVKTGLQIIEREKLDTVLKEMVFSKTGLTQSDGIKIGKMLNADSVIFGTVTSFVQGSSTDKSPTKKLEKTRVGIIIKAVHIETGVILWKCSVHNQIDNAFSYTNPVEGHAIMVSENIIDELIKKGLYR